MLLLKVDMTLFSSHSAIFFIFCGFQNYEEEVMMMNRYMQQTAKPVYTKCFKKCSLTGHLGTQRLRGVRKTSLGAQDGKSLQMQFVAVYLQNDILSTYLPSTLYCFIVGQYSQSASCSQAVTRAAGSSTCSYQDVGGGASERHPFSPQ